MDLLTVRYPFFGNSCSSTSFQGRQTSTGQNPTGVTSTVYVSVDFIQSWRSNTDLSCGQVALSTTCSSTGTYIWEASANRADNWKTIPCTTGSYIDPGGHFGHGPGSLCTGLCPGERSWPSESYVATKNILLKGARRNDTLVSETQPVCHGNTNGSVTLNVSNAYVDRFI